MWTFNPGLLRDGDGWLLAARIVGGDQKRRIALCRLDGRFRVIAGSQRATSDAIHFPAAAALCERARTWFADPRLFRLDGRIFLYWNSGWHEPENHQFIQELSAGGLAPLGAPRELLLRGPRRPLEKNWTFFGEPSGHALYSIAPHRILRFNLDGEGPIELTPCAEIEWDAREFAARWGELCGGAPPQRLGDHYYAFCHAHHFDADGLRYVAAAYRFAASPPFPPADVPLRPIELPNPFGPRNALERLNPVVGSVVYPCGASFEDGRWAISYGINDERCAIALLPHAEVMDSLRPLAGAH